VHAKVRDVYDLGDLQSNDIDNGNEQVLEGINDNDLIRVEVDDSDDIIEVQINMEDCDTGDESEEDYVCFPLKVCITSFRSFHFN